MAAPLSTCTTIEQRGVVRFLWAKNMEHPPYSPDLTPSDFHLFGPLKHHVSGERFPDNDAVERAVHAWFQQQPKEFYATAFQGLVKRWDKCLNLCGDYVGKINVLCMSLSPFDSFQSRFVTYSLNCPHNCSSSISSSVTITNIAATAAALVVAAAAATEQY
jgi:hypothetical protein